MQYGQRLPRSAWYVEKVSGQKEVDLCPTRFQKTLWLVPILLVILFPVRVSGQERGRRRHARIGRPAVRCHRLPAKGNEPEWIVLTGDDGKSGIDRRAALSWLIT
jgi:hypothetical protein